MTESEPQMDPLRALMLTRLQRMGTRGEPLSPDEALDKHPDAPISRAYFYRLLEGKRPKRMGDRVVSAVATVLEVDPKLVYKAVDEPMPQTHWVWPKAFDRVAPEHREMFEDLVAAFLAAERRGYERGRNQA